MNATGPVKRECMEVEFCTIAAMTIKAILRKFLRIRGHAVIAADLGDDAGGGDGERFPIALDDALVREGKEFHGEAIDEAEVDTELMFFLKCLCGGGHAVVGGAEDIEGVDGGGIDLDLRPQHRGIFDQLMIEFLTFFGADFFGIVQPRQGKVRRQDHSGHRYRTGKRPAPGFIDATDPRVSSGAGGVFILHVGHRSDGSDSWR